MQTPIARRTGPRRATGRRIRSRQGLRHAVVAIAAVAFGLGRPALAAAQQVPSGFVVETVVGQPLASQVTAFAFLPDGRIVVLEKDTGGIRLAAVGSTAPALIGTIAGVSIAAERGLLGVAVDPSWPARPYLYVLFTHTSSTLRLIMLPVSGDLSEPGSTAVQLGSPYLVLDDLPDNFDNHNGGTLRFGSDGFLYASLGDDSRGCEAQDPSIHLGKILRLDVATLPEPGPGPPPKSSLVAAGNPFFGSANARLVWALGFRNPFRFTIDRITGTVFVGDVGLETWEEVNEVGSGLNYGWPEFEGPLQDPDPNTADCSMGPFTAPIYAYPNPPGGNVASVVCGPVYRAPVAATDPFPHAYDGDLFVCEFYARWIRRLTPTTGGWTLAEPVPGQPSASEWAADLGNIADLQVGPDGALYFLVMFNGGFLPRGVHRIVNTLPSDSGTGFEPGARLTVAPNPVPRGAATTVWFRASGGGSTTAVPRNARILDVAGRCIRELSWTPAARGTWTARWDGRTGDDVEAAAGLYLVEVRGADGSGTRAKLTRLR